ncbi:hypothetical protein C0J52_03738 [Blattella germanica]|nr:hypothetical protein C0J52_03738 [Blattella germanica]
MKLIIFTLAALLHLCMGDSHNAICNSLYSEAPVDSPECIQEITDHLNEEGNVTCTMDTEITWIVIDPDAGIVTFELNLPPSSCRFEAYDLELNIDESISDPEMCTNASVVELHSRRYLTIKRHHQPNRILPDCDKVANITFHNVYSGCYILDIIPMLENRKKAKSETGEMLYQFKGPMFIHTNYTKTLLVNTFPYISTHYVESSQELRFMYNMNIPNVLRMEIESRVCKNSTSSCGSGSRQHFWEMALSNSGNVMCLNRSGSSLTPTCHVVQFIDDRCEPYTVWYNESTKNKCLFSSRIAPIPIPNATSSTGPVPIPGTPGHVINILISVFVVVGLILIGVFIYLWRKRKPGLDIGACSCLKYNILEYYNKIDDKQTESMVKQLNDNC